ncbi:RNA polymerase sigma factor [Streptomyces sp. CAI-85]|uniref:RNA polymerase sigma factor n=1 Tax=Streptomyces sp. CAI-85 TaxID=1472662 RepID=UPI001587D784|nr:sigma-70 family RNA polymerase sigma factor [Streptomyces sp. CAI-85]NUV64880.1 sigma-70 family RNA polymerase sigma factor [Streptomyces sp. CAI-85]
MGSEAVDHEVFNAFFKDQYPKVVAMLICHHRFTRQVAEDAVAESMTLLLLNWERVRAPMAWVRTVAFREAVRQAKQQHEPLPETPLTDEHAAGDLAALEMALTTGAAVKSLPRRQQEVMTLTLADMKPGEIAEILDCTSEQARGNLSHARRTLRRELGMEEGV